MITSRAEFGVKLEKNYISNQYRVHKFDDEHILITTDNGAWVVLNSKEYRLFRTERVQENISLYSALKENGIIVTKDNINKVVEDYRERYRFLFKGPNLHIMVPTFRCNLRCVYCHSFSKTRRIRKGSPCHFVSFAYINGLHVVFLLFGNIFSTLSTIPFQIACGNRMTALDVDRLYVLVLSVT